MITAMAEIDTDNILDNLRFQDDRFLKFQEKRQAHWQAVAESHDGWRGLGSYYHRRLVQIYQFLVAPHQRVLEVGCSEGNLLAALKPSVGVGIDFCAAMIERASKQHPTLRFEVADAHSLGLDETFDVVILSDLLNDVWDIQQCLTEVAKICIPSTRIIINSYSRLWELPLKAGQALNLATPTLTQNWLTVDDIDDLLYLTDFEMIHHWPEVIFPLAIPGLNTLLNCYVGKTAPFKNLALTNFVVARPRSQIQLIEEPSVSVIVPARNEAGNIAQIFSRTPRMGRHTEIVFVEGHSRDNTFQAIEENIASHSEWASKLIKQTGVGKGDAVRQGFAEASGDILMILDADLTVPPEDLPRFYEVLRSGKGEFVNGVRLVYPMEEEAMRFLNFLGNKFFSYAFSWILGQPIKDTLCGTKVLWKTAYNRISANRSYFGDFDPFGDFDLLFGAAKQNLKIVEMPIRYRSREYGTTNISRWRHGMLLLRMVVFALRRIKFV